jgi:hypothetical protein
MDGVLHTGVNWKEIIGQAAYPFPIRPESLTAGIPDTPAAGFDRDQLPAEASNTFPTKQKPNYGPWATNPSRR